MKLADANIEECVLEYTVAWSMADCILSKGKIKEDIQKQKGKRR